MANPGGMSTKAFRALEEQLHAPAPTGLAHLEDRHLEDLAGSIRKARHRQAAELASAGDKAFALVPRLLRGPVRKVLG